MKSFAFAALALFFAASPAFADVVHNPKEVHAGSYAVEPTHTQIEFGISHLGFTTYFGRFSGATGSLQLQPATPDGSTLSVSVPTNSISTTSAKLDDELRGAEWLDAAKFPQITFTSTKVVATGADAQVTGNLLLHGVTRPVTLHAHFVGAGVNPIDHKYTVGFQASGAIKRSDFGIKTYLPMIGDVVQLTISGAFEQN